jgi:uncharacterized protein YprB with RNaseH-like and TPR domain
MSAVFIKKEWSVPLSISGTIVDVETTALEPKDGELITLGVFFGNSIKIFQRTDVSKEGNERFLRALSNWQDICPRPFYAYNKNFEEKWTRASFDHDLMAKWRVEAENKRTGDKALKWPRVCELISLPHDYYGIHDIDGRDVPKLWREYTKTRDLAKLNLIITHNLFDLIREACLLLWDETTLKVCAEILIKHVMKERKGL